MQASDLFLESGRSSFKARGSGFPVLEGPSLCLTGSEIVNVPKACIDFLGQSRFRIHIGKAKPARKGMSSAPGTSTLSIPIH